MDIMKKFGLFLIAAIAVTAFTSCNDDDGGEPLRTLITTVRTLDGGDYYFQRDNGETLYPGNKSRVPGYKPDPDKTQRVIIWFTLQNGIADYDYNIDLYFVENIYTGTSVFIVTVSYFVIFRILGKSYDAAVMCSGLCGHGLGATPTAIVNMTAVTERYGMSSRAFMVVPIVGAFLVDLIYQPQTIAFIKFFVPAASNLVG